MTSEPSRPAVSATPVSRRPWLLAAGAAGLCWAGTLAMLLTPHLSAAPFSSFIRFIYYALVCAAALLTFVPVQHALRTPGLALEGVCGAFVLMYALAFIPPPQAPIFVLSELPVYAIFLGSLGAFISAAALPLVFLLGARVFHRRTRQYDLRRAWRQAHGIGMLFVACGVLAALRILSPLSLLLVILIIVVAEILFLAYVEAPA